MSQLVPGAAFDPGAHWNYPAGVSSCDMVVGHYTVGNDSRALIRDQGLAPVLIRDDVIWQYAPLDAVCYTQCEWNRRAIGLEVESVDGWLSDAELGGLGYVTTWAMTQNGIPPNLYAEGPRLPVGTPFVGITNHRQLQHLACDQHTDGYDTAVWLAALGAGQPAPPDDDQEDDDVMYVWCESDPNDPAHAVGIVLSGALIVYESTGHPPGFAGNPDDPWLNAFLTGDNGFGSSPIKVRRKVLPSKVTQIRNAHKRLTAAA